MSRRKFLKIGVFSGTVLAVGCYLSLGGEKSKSGQQLWPAHSADFKPNAWVCVGKDDSITIRVHHTELGQGISTALAMVVAEEIDAAWDSIKTEIAPAEAVYKNPEYKIQMTAGSTSVKTSWVPLRQAGAMARKLLISAAAAHWRVDSDTCSTGQGTVMHKKTGRKLRYGQLVDAASCLSLPEQVKLKRPEQYHIIGSPIPRLDIPDKTTGRATFGIDFHLPGLIHATVIHPPAFGTRLISFDDTDARRCPGVRNILAIRSGIAVVAETFWQAKTAADTLKIEWQTDSQNEMTTAAIQARWKTLMQEKGKHLFQRGDTDKAFEAASHTIQAIYELPYQGHATPEPMNCTAHVKRDRCDIWVPTQNQDAAQETAARITGLGYDQVCVHTTFAGGGFGRRVAVDYVAEAVEISQAVQMPVKVVWTREEDMQNDCFRPAMTVNVKAAIDDRGVPTAWYYQMVGSDHMAHQLPDLIPCILPYGVPRALRNMIGGLAKVVLPRVVPGKKAAEGAAPLAYAIENVTVAYVHDDPGIPLGFWRSVAFSQNVFFVESFVDEIAAAAGRDPLELRLDLLQQSPRLRNVLKIAAEKANWPQNRSGNLYQGLAVYDFHGTSLAAVAEISMGPGGTIRVHRVVCAVDCGVAIHPRIVEDQISSGIAFGLTATLKSHITLTRGKVDQSNFHNFRLLRMDEMPAVQVHIVSGDHPPTGIGEAGVPLIGPAVANAVYAATGKRIRHLPIYPADLAT